MKKTLSLVTIIALVLTLCTSTCSVSASNFTPNAGKGNSKKNTTASATLYGRFSITSVGVDVALYSSNSQAVCDAEDSACFFNNTIVDHANQGFRAIRNVIVGDTATITRVDGTLINLVCAEAYDGYNTGSGIFDANGKSAMGTHAYMSYTCLDSTGYGVHIVQWDVVPDTATNTTTTAPAPTKTKGNGNSKKNK